MRLDFNDKVKKKGCFLVLHKNTSSTAMLNHFYAWAAVLVFMVN